MALKVTPLSSALGAEITEIDLRQPQDEAAVKAIRKAFDGHILWCSASSSCPRTTSCAPPAISARSMCGGSLAAGLTNPGGELRHAIHAGHQHRGERQVDRRVRRR